MNELIIVDTREVEHDDSKLICYHKQCRKCKSDFLNLFKIKNQKKITMIEMAKDNDCPICNNSKYDLKDANSDINTLNRIVEQTINNTPGTKLRYKQIGKQFKNWVLAGSIYSEEINRYGNIQDKDKYLFLQCTDCGFIKKIDADQYNDICDIVCNNCKKLLRDRNREKFEKSLKLVENNFSVFENIKKKDKETKEKAQRVYEEQTSVSVNEKKDASSISKIKKSLSESNPNLHILDMYTKDGIQYSVLKCDKCGSKLEINTFKLRELKKYTCDGCEAQLNNPRYRGIFSRKMVGTVINAMRCIEETDEKLRLECTICGKKTKNDKDKEKFILGKIYCSNTNCSEIDTICPNCYNMNSISIKDINNAKSSDAITCKKCGVPIYAEALIDLDTINKSSEVNGVLKELMNQSEKSVVLDGVIGRSKKPVYVDSNGKQYYNCRCTEHKQTCILSETEIKMDPHMFCNNEKDIYVSEKEILKLKLNNEKSYIEHLLDKESK